MFCDDEHIILPWDYFLTEYERDLLIFPLEKSQRKYGLVPDEQVLEDWESLKKLYDAEQFGYFRRARTRTFSFKKILDRFFE